MFKINLLLNPEIVTDPKSLLFILDISGFTEFVQSIEVGHSQHVITDLLEVDFLDGSAYEYFGVNKNVFQKMINSDKQARFAKRSHYNSYKYRKSKKVKVAEEAEVA